MKRRDPAIHFARFVIFVIVIAALMMTQSCATNKDLVLLRDEMNTRNDAVESRLDSIARSVAELDSLAREQQRLSQSIRALVGAQAQSQRDEIELIAARQEEINYQLRELLESMQAIQLYGGAQSSQPTVAPAAAAAARAAEAEASPSTAPAPPAAPEQTPRSEPTAAETSSVDPQKLYDAAPTDIRNDRYTLAESRFLSFLMQFPQNDLAGNAQYWLGEAVYGQGKYELAIKEFEKVISKYPKSPKVPAAMLKIGFAQKELGKNREALETLNRLIASYPQSGEADLARERLNAPQAQPESPTDN